MLVCVTEKMTSENLVWQVEKLGEVGRSLDGLCPRCDCWGWSVAHRWCVFESVSDGSLGEGTTGTSP